MSHPAGRLTRVALAVAALIAAVAPARAVPPLAGGAIASDNVELVATIPDVGAVGARIIGDLLYVTTAQGLRVYSIADEVPLAVGALELPHVQNEDVDTNGDVLLIAADHFVGFPEMLYVVDVSDPRLPTLLAALQVDAAHTASCIDACSFAWLGGARGRVVVADLRDPRAPVQVGSFPIPGSVHDVQVDAAGIAWVSTSGGLFGYRTDDPVQPEQVAALPNDAPGSFENDFIVHNSLRPNADRAVERAPGDDDPVVRDGELLLVTEEDWLTFDNDRCRNDGVFQTGRYVRTAGGGTIVERLDTFNLGRATLPTDRKPTAVVSCSSHYFDHRDGGLVAVAWYEQGTRFLDVSDPRAIRQVGFFMPIAGESISALIRGDIVYVFDTQRGIDVLRFTGGTGSPTVLAPLAPDAPRRGPSPAWGYLCRL